MAWYACYNYTMSRWQGRGGLHKITKDGPVQLSPLSSSDDPEYCADEFGQKHDRKRFQTDTNQNAWWSEGAFGWV
jgi:hypothetical protein